MNSKVKIKKPLSVIEQIQKIEDANFLRALSKAIGVIQMEVSVHDCSFGSVLIGSYQDKVQSIEFGKDKDECYRNLINRRTKYVRNVQPRLNHSLADRVLRVIEEGITDPTIEVSFGDVGTYFQRRVWETIRSISPGQTLSYKDIANQIGYPDAFRAVGTACGANPVAVIVPCHRVVKSDGSPGGYRWNLDIKRKLLQRENI